MIDPGVGRNPSPIILDPPHVMESYRAVSALYPFIPPMIIWRGWEHAAYRLFALQEPALDVGCGDGTFFRFLWPGCEDVTGLDIDRSTVEAARAAGVYRDVRCGVADALPFQAGTFNSVFANCSLEHMDNLTAVLENVERCLSPRGSFLLSVITDNWARWDILPQLFDLTGDSKGADRLRSRYVAYHHHVNILSSTEWMNRLQLAGFTLIAHVPIVPQQTARLFLLLDQVWHMAYGAGEAGDLLASHFRQIHGYPAAFFEILSGMLHMEADRSCCCGAVFHAIKGNGTR